MRRSKSAGSCRELNRVRVSRRLELGQGRHSTEPRHVCGEQRARAFGEAHARFELVNEKMHSSGPRLKLPKMLLSCAADAHAVRRANTRVALLPANPPLVVVWQGKRMVEQHSSSAPRTPLLEVEQGCETALFLALFSYMLPPLAAVVLQGRDETPDLRQA